jgi:hypothetical protein
MAAPVTTENGAASYGTVSDALTELMFKTTRDLAHTEYNAYLKSPVKRTGDDTYLVTTFLKAWEEDTLMTLRFVFYLRDCRGGKGEKALFRALVKILRNNVDCRVHLLHNIKHFPYYGSWKDLLACFMGTPMEDDALALFADQLKQDIASTEQPSICAKYAPTEGGQIDATYQVVHKLCKILGISPTYYRRGYLVPLRIKLNIVERQMCANEWKKIEYEKIPSIASSNYKKAFERHDEKRYNRFIAQVMAGKAKMNVGVLMPYQMVSGIIDHVKEAQWVSFVNERRKLWNPKISILPLVDVSGSMSRGPSSNVTPLHIALSLGLLFATLSQQPNYKNRFITFSEEPELVEIKGDTLSEQVANMTATHWGNNTNFQAVFDLILSTAIENKLKQEDLPTYLLVLSDMQFDVVEKNKDTIMWNRTQHVSDESDDQVSNWDAISQKFSEAGYKRPAIIFWNLCSSNIDFPIPNANVSDCALISGYNDGILYSILDGKTPNPADVVRAQLNSERYSRITLRQ